MEAQFRGAVLVFSLLFLTGIGLSGGARAEWAWANPSPQGDILDDIVWGGSPGLFVTVGHLGTILTSATGEAGTWQAQRSGTTAWLQDIEWDGSRFLAVGYDGVILVSPDGRQWFPQASPTTAALYAVTWSGTQYIAVGSGGTVLSSPDAERWTQRFSGSGAWLNDVAWNGAQFIAVGSQGTALSSTDGVTWAPTPGIPSGLPSFEGVAWSGSRFVIIGYGGAILSSPDGRNWTQRTSGTDGWLRKIEWIGGRFTILGGDGILLSSSDGLTWEAQASNSGELLEDIALAPDGTQVIIGKHGEILRNAGSGGWSSQRLGASVRLESVALNGKAYVAVGEAGTVLSGTLGSIPGTRTVAGSVSLHDVVWDGGRYIAAGDGGTLLTSSDGSQWNAVQQGVESALKAISVGNIGGSSEYVVVGEGGSILAGNRPDTLAPQSSGTDVSLNNVLWDGKLFIAVGGGGTIITSTDGANWVRQTTGTAEDLLAVAYGNGTYVTVGRRGTVLKSLDATAWSAVDTGSRIAYRDINDVAWDGSRFIAVSTSDALADNVLTSSDGMQWATQPGTANPLFAVATDPYGTVLAGGAGTLLYTSPCPCAVDDWAMTGAGTSATIAVLENDVGENLQISSMASVSGAGGRLTLNADGSVTYTPGAEFVGADTFTYEITDGAGNYSAALVTVQVTAPVATDGSGTEGASGADTTKSADGPSGSTSTTSGDGGSVQAESQLAAHSGGGGAGALLLLLAAGLILRRRLWGTN